MSDVVICAENLGKKYTIGHQAENGRYNALRDVVMQNARNIWQKTRDLIQGKSIIQGDLQEDVWALKDINFEIRQGEAVGIIGRNGAGKSTLLKILSRITEPSTGRVTIKGRVASLLEVGTGFHPELSGRENISLNGAILGMTRREIGRKFDEIVAFAEVEKYLDTPVKRYSSGMYVRLAFAVAAHLEPEILVVDEVLAVGDAEFQKKCLGKMSDVVGDGRTVLFVSHNMAAVQALCDYGLLLRSGSIQFADSMDNVIRQYQAVLETDFATPLSERVDRKGSGRFRFNDFFLLNQHGIRCTYPCSGDDIIFALEYIADEEVSLEKVVVAIVISTMSGQRLFTLHSEFTGNAFAGKSSKGQFRCTVPKIPLAPGQYSITLWASAGGDVIDWIKDACSFTIHAGNYYGTGRLPKVSLHGPFMVSHKWESLEHGQAYDFETIS